MSRNYQLIRAIFVAGCILNIILTFIPMYVVEAPGLFGLFKVKRSIFDGIQLAFNIGGSEGFFYGFLYVLIFAAYIIFAVLAIVYQKRWVFIAGASVAAFTLLLEFLSSDVEGVEAILLPKLLWYIATIAMLSGYFVKPPISTTERSF